MNYQIEQTSDIALARKWWEELNQNTSAFDNWDFRACFFQYTGLDLRFISAQKDGEILALLPLQRNKKNECWEIFGGAIMEDNTLFWKEKDIEAPKILLNSIKEEFTMQYCRDFSHILPPDEYSLHQHGEKFILNLEQVSSLDSFFQLFSSKSKAQLKKKIKEIEEQKIQIFFGRSNDIDALIEFNLQKFGEKSNFNMIGRKEAFQKLTTLPIAQMLSFEINGQLQGISFCVSANGCLAYLNAGVRSDAVPNLGTYIVVKNIEHALELGARIFDAGAYPFNWKERMHLENIPVWELLRNA